MRDFKTFMSLTDSAIAEEFASILEANQIQFKVQDTSKDFDASFSNDKARHSILLMLDPRDFDLANQVLESKTTFDISAFDKNHPFFSFTSEELIDVVKNYDEWNPYDVKLAKHLLEKQDILMNSRDIETFQKVKEISAEVKEQTSSNRLMIITGYLFCLLGGFIGIGIGLFLISAKKTNLSGQKEYVYNPTERTHGYLMLFAGVVIFLLYINFKILN
ncbi:hypothetical protein [Flavobacterium terrisoli]|uniref:hypothetical protein n=1 Tax=Flavobacterium terrisoli TaxID=3242195 RepID=UPI0025430541|nr:hypothetical protein [Flavobacterium buctense]